MSELLIAFIFTLGASAWIFNKLQRYSGNNTRQSAIATGASAAAIFIIIFTVLKLIF